jgi:hypothetical protein
MLNISRYGGSLERCVLLRGVPSSTLCVIFAFLALFAVDCHKGSFHAKYAKNRKVRKDFPVYSGHDAVIDCGYDL